MQQLQSSRTTCTKTPSMVLRVCSVPAQPLQRFGVRSRALCATAPEEWGGLQACCCGAVSAALSALLNILGSVCLSAFVWCSILKANPAGWEATLNRTAVC